MSCRLQKIVDRTLDRHQFILVKELRGGHYDDFTEDGTVTQTTQEAGEGVF